MGIKSELQAIELELKSIEESKGRINHYIDELTKHCSYKIGDKLKGDKPQFLGKEFIVDEVGVCGLSDSLPTHFYARGRMIKVNGELGTLTTSCSEKIILK